MPEKGRQNRGRPPIDLGAVRERRAADGLLERIMPYALQREQDLEEAVEAYFGYPVDPEHLPQDQVGAFLDWFVFGYREERRGRKMPELYLEEQGGNLEPGAAALVRRWLATVPDAYRLVEAEGLTLTLRHRSGLLFRVLAPAEEDVPPPGALLVARLLPVGPDYRLSPGRRWFRGELAEPLAQVLNWEQQRMALQHPEATVEDVLRERQPLLDDALMVAGLLAESGTRLEVENQHPGRTPSRFAEEDDFAQAVEGMLAERLGEMAVPWSHRYRVQLLWQDAAARIRSSRGRPEGWAAGAAYAYFGTVHPDRWTQQAFATGFGVSTATVGKRARDIGAALQLTVLDPRYAHPLDPQVRTWNRLLLLRNLGRAADFSEEDFFVPTLTTERAVAALFQVSEHLGEEEYRQAETILENLELGHLPPAHRLAYHWVRVNLYLQTGRINAAEGVVAQVREHFPGAETLAQMEEILEVYRDLQVVMDREEGRRLQAAEKWLERPVDPAATLVELLTRRHYQSLQVSAEFLGKPEWKTGRKPDLALALARHIAQELPAVLARLKRSDRSLLRWILEEGGQVPVEWALRRQAGLPPQSEESRATFTSIDRLYRCGLLVGGTIAWPQGGQGPALAVPVALRKDLDKALREYE